jgi:hypothetical protein
MSTEKPPAPRERRDARDQFIRETVFQELALALELTDEAWLKRHLDAAFAKGAAAWERLTGDSPA